MHCTGYGAGAVNSSCLVSRPFCEWGAARRHGSGSQLPHSLKGVTPAVAHTTLFRVLRARSCREGPEHFGPTFLALFGLASSGRVTSFSRVTRLLSLLRTGGPRLMHPSCDRLGCSASKWWLTPKWERVECLSNRTGCSYTGSGQRSPRLVCAWLQINDHQPHARTGCVDDTKLLHYTVFEKFATHNDGDAPPLQSLGKERDQKLYLQPTCTTQDVVTSMSGPARNGQRRDRR